MELRLEYDIVYLENFFDEKADKLDWKVNEFKIPVRYLDRLREIVQECLLCYRVVAIMHSGNIVVQFNADCLPLADRFDLNLPPFMDDVIEYDQKYNNLIFQRIAYRLTKMYTCVKQLDGTYGWKCK